MNNWYPSGYLSEILSSSYLSQNIENNFPGLIHWLHHWACLTGHFLRSFFSTEGFKFDCFTLNHWILLISKLHAYILLLLNLMWINSSLFTNLLFLTTEFRQISDGNAIGIYIWHCSSLQVSQKCLGVWLEKGKKSIERTLERT